MKEKLLQYINENLKDNNLFGFKKARFEVERCCSYSASSLEDMEYPEEAPIRSKNAGSFDLENYINENNNDEKFQELLFKYIDERELKDSDVYNKVHIDRRLFSKIRNEKYHPSKETVILLGLALELNENQFDELLASASYSLPKNNVYDLIIRFCFVEGIYNLKDVNELLNSYECKLFSY